MFQKYWSWWYYSNIRSGFRLSTYSFLIFLVLQPIHIQLSSKTIPWEIFNIRIIKLHASNNRFFIEQRAKRGHGLPCNRFRSRIFERKKMPAVISAFPFPLPLERKLAVEGALRKARALYWNWTHPDNPNLRSPPSFSSSLQRSLSLSSYPPSLSLSFSSAIEFTAFANPFRVADHPALKLVAAQREKSPGEMPCFKPALVISFGRE